MALGAEAIVWSNKRLSIEALRRFNIPSSSYNHLAAGILVSCSQDSEPNVRSGMAPDCRSEKGTNAHSQWNTYWILGVQVQTTATFALSLSKAYQSFCNITCQDHFGNTDWYDLHLCGNYASAPPYIRVVPLEHLVESVRH